MKTIINSDTQNVIPLRSLREYLAAERTELVLETTQLAWVRTVLTFIAVGFTVSKGAEAMGRAGFITGQSLISNANIAGIILTITGTVMLTATTFYFIARRRQLAKIRGTYLYKIIPILLTSACTILVGLGLSYMLIVS